MLRSPLFPIFLTVLVDVMAMTLVLPLLPYYAEHFGASPIVVTSLLSSFAVCQLISGPILGRVSDRVGRKPTLLVSQIGTFVGFMVLGGAHSLWMLFLGRIIDGLTAGNLSIAQAYISDVTTPENRTKAFGLIGIAFGTGFLVGPAISGFLGDHFGYSAPAYMAAGLSATSILVTALILPESPKAARAPREAGGRFWLLRRPELRWHLLQFLAFALAFSMLTSGLGLFLIGRFSFKMSQTGYIYAYSGLIGGLMQGGIGRLAKRLGEPKLALLGFLGMAIGYCLLSVAFNLPILLAVTMIGAAGSAVVRPALTTLVTKSVDRTEQGTALGLSQSVTSSAQIIAPEIAGLLIQGGRYGAYGLAAGAFAAIGAILMFFEREPTIPASA